MAVVKSNISVLDRIDGQPAIILPNQNFAIWSTELNKYIDTGMRATPEDDANSVKYYKTTKTSTIPSAPTRTGGWNKLKDLDAALSGAGWMADPQDVSDEYRFQWMAVYGKENMPSPNSETGVVEFVPRYTYSKTALYNNFAPSPVITVDESTKTITITNPDGTKITTEFATAEGVDALMEIVKGLQKQVDKAIYSHDGSGVPAMDKMPVTDWLKSSNGTPITDDKTKAEIFSTHIGDLYYDTRPAEQGGQKSYKFTLKDGGVSTNPADYKWELISDSAVTEALKQISDLAGDTVKIWTEAPVDGDSYKVGDIWLYRDADNKWRYRHCIKSNQPPQYAYSAVDWVEPYATIEDVTKLRSKLESLTNDLSTAKANITDLKKETENIKGAWIESVKDGIISEQERKSLEDTSQRIDEEQAQLQSNVDYILASDYFSDKDGFSNKANAVLQSGNGSIDKLQDAITKAIADNKITDDELTAVKTAFAVYESTREELLKAIKDAKSEIDKQIPASVQVGGRNLLLKSNEGISNSVYSVGRYDIADPSMMIAGETYTIQIWGEAEGVDFSETLWVFNSGTVTKLADIQKRDNGVWKQTFKWMDDADKSNSYLAIFRHANHPSYKKGSRTSITKIKLEKGTVATDWTPAPEDVQAEIDAINANPPRINDKGTWEVYVPSQGKYVDTERTSKGDIGKAPIVRNGNWYEWDAGIGDYTDTGIKAQGKDGEGALVCVLNRQGSFRTTYRTVDNSGNVLSEPKAIKSVEGGVNGKVVITATIKKGTVDVTEKAKTNGGNFKWLLNGTQIASGSATLQLGIGDHVDGKTDEIEFLFDDTNAKDW